MITKYIVGSDRCQYKFIGGFFLIGGFLLAMIFASDINNEYMFASEGTKSKAIVTGESYMVMGSRMPRGSTSQVAFDYDYSVEGKEYKNHAPNNNIRHNKGDVIDIEYLKSNPGVSRFIGDARSVSDVKLLLSICGIGMLIGLVMLFFPNQPPPDGEEEMDWSEYERTHE